MLKTITSATSDIATAIFYTFLKQSIKRRMIMRTISKIISIMLSVCILTNLSLIKVFANTSKNIYIDLINNRDNMYFDETVGANVIAFKLLANGDVKYLTKEEAEAGKKVDDMQVNVATDIKKTNIKFRDYMNWYIFKQTYGPVHYEGGIKKISADIKAPRKGGSISLNVGYTSKHFFSATIGIEAKKLAIQAGASIAWEESASTSITYTFDLKAGDRGYVGFRPYYNKVEGELELHGNWGDGLIGVEKGVAGYSVKKTALGDADGEYTFVFK